LLKITKALNICYVIIYAGRGIHVIIAKMTLNFFNSLEHLEPKCKNCSTKIEYGVTTRYDEDKQAHICLKCGNVVE